MSYRAGLTVLTLCSVVTLAGTCDAQTLGAKDYPYAPGASSSGEKTSKAHKSTALAEQERLAAISILTLLADESERYRDPTLRVRTQAQVADALWETDETLARNLFVKAWAAAEDVDTAGEQNAEVDRKKVLSSRSSGLTILRPPPNLRLEVLRLAARRDPALGGRLIDRLDDIKDETEAPEEKSAPQKFFDPTEPRQAIARRLEVAIRLLEAGDIKQAKQFALPALAYVTSQGIIFLCNLRRSDGQSADELYGSLLTRAGSDPRTDATTVSLLSSYLFTPNLLVTATQRGRVSNRFADATVHPELSPALRATFFAIAARILLRPTTSIELDHTSAGRAGTYFTIARLLPLFEQYASNYLPALKAQLTVLAPDAPEAFRNGAEDMLTVGLVPADSDSDSLARILDQLDDAKSSAERDVIYVKAIRAGAIGRDGRIGEFAEKIDNLALKERARSFAALALVRRAISRKKPEAAWRIVNDGYLPPLQRTWALAEIARQLKKSNPERALEALNEAAVEANRIGVGEHDRVYALVCVSQSLFEFDHERWWNGVSDIIKAANAVPAFAAEEGKLYALLRTRNVIATIDAAESSFDMVKVFTSLANDDLQVAVTVANSLVGEAPRASANLAIARSVLNRPRLPLSPGRK
jgi:hypothetical protein